VPSDLQPGRTLDGPIQKNKLNHINAMEKCMNHWEIRYNSGSFSDEPSSYPVTGTEASIKTWHDSSKEHNDRNPTHFRLTAEAHRIRLAFQYDPHFAVSVSQVDPLPHQMDAVYTHLLTQPRIRFLIADDPGAGKTIMAGLLIKELKFRGLIERTLIITPANLTDQWRRELLDKFGETFSVVNRATINAAYGRNVWEDTPQCITSIDFVARQDDILNLLRDVHFDLCIVDEAHQMAAYRYGTKVNKTQRYELGEFLREHTDHYLFLTATPHKGDPDNFALLLQLLDQDLYVNGHILAEAQRP